VDEKNPIRQRPHPWSRVDFAACFEGYKQSGNRREWGQAGLEEFLELKAIFGYATPSK
jgi:aldehyde dehydrogenase (NAD+)